MSDGMGRELAYLSSHATNRYFIPNWGKYNPDQFEIIGLGIANLGLSIGVQPYKPEHKKYRKEIQKRGAVDGDLYMMNGDEVVVPYARILIRRKK